MPVGALRLAYVSVSGRGGGVETTTPEDSVRERLVPDGDDLVQAGLREPRGERLRAFGEGVEERGGKHVAGHPAYGIQVNVHAPDSTPVPRHVRGGWRPGAEDSTAQHPGS